MLPKGKIVGTVTGVSVIAFEKNGKKYGMSDSWVTMVDNHRIALLLGPQSTTKDVLEINDVVGICSLNENQMDIAVRFGISHSNEVDKFIDFDYMQNDSAILIPNASTQMTCILESMSPIKPGGHARLCIFRVLDFHKNNIPFLIYEKNNKNSV